MIFDAWSSITEYSITERRITERSIDQVDLLLKTEIISFFNSA